MSSVQTIRAKKLEWARAVSGLKFVSDYWSKANKFQNDHAYRALQRLEKIIMEIDEMARGTKKPKQTWEWRGFVNVRMSSEEKAKFEAWDVHDDEVWDMLAYLLGSGYKLTQTATEDGNGVQVSCTGTENHKTNMGYCVTAFAPTMYEAFRVLLFKVTVLMPDDWAELKASKSSETYG